MGGGDGLKALGRQAAGQPTQEFSSSLARAEGSISGAFLHPISFLLSANPIETVSANTELGQCSGVRPQGGF